MLIVGGGLYCEIFFQICFSFFIFFPNALINFIFLIIFLFMFIFNFILDALLNPYFKKGIQTIFQGGTSWVAQLLNNIIVWMVLYCEHQLLGWKKNKTLSPPFFG